MAEPIFNVTKNPANVKRINFKVCPKCGGKMGLTSDESGAYWDCISCGKTEDIILEPVYAKIDAKFLEDK